MSDTETQHDGHDHSTRGALIRLIVVIVAVCAAALATGYFNTVLVLFAIILMVMIHEFGHFLTAKWSGMKVTEYFLGFGPKLWSFRRGETEYGVKAIPAGGYVRISGMNNLERVSAEDEPRTYRQQPYWQRLLVASAGSFMHFVMAFLLLLVLFAGFGSRFGTTVAETATTTVSPAAAAGLRGDDVIRAIDGRPVSYWTDVQAYVAQRPNQAVTLQVQRGTQTLELPVTLTNQQAAGLTGGRATTGYLGARAATEYVRVPFFSAIGQSVQTMRDGFTQVVNAIVNRFSPSGIASVVRQVGDARENGAARAAAERNNQPAPVTETDQDGARLSSPLGIANLADQAATAGIRSVIVFLASVNLFVGLFNLIPLLPFDGGHIAIATYEKLRSLRGRRHTVDFNKMIPVSYAVLGILVVMGLSALWIDAWYPAQDVFG